MEFLLLELDDLAEIGKLQPEGWGDIVAPTKRNIQSPFCSAYKAVVDGSIAGTAAVIYNGNSAWLSTIIVHPAYRNRGLGHRMTQLLIDTIDRNRYETILLDATDFGYPVYKKLGFVTIAYHAHFEGLPLAQASVGDLHIQPYKAGYLAEILLLDRMATGEDRSALLLGYLDSCVIYVADNRVQGFYMPALMRGLVVAEDADAGIALMKARMATQCSCMLPADNKVAINFLNRAGYTQTHLSRRMSLGPTVAWTPGNIYNVAGGAIG